MTQIDFKDWIEKIELSPWNDMWITVYEEYKDEFEIRGIYSALIPDEFVSKSLNDEGWDLLKGQGHPDFGHFVPLEKIFYLRFGNFENIEPLIFYREFFGIKESYIEMSQEFILYFNLYFNSDLQVYFRILKNGDEEDVIKFSNDMVQIKLKYLKEYISVKQGFLALFYEIRRGSPRSLSELGLQNINNIQ